MAEVILHFRHLFVSTVIRWGRPSVAAPKLLFSNIPILISNDWSPLTADSTNFFCKIFFRLGFAA